MEQIITKIDGAAFELRNFNRKENNLHLNEIITKLNEIGSLFNKYEDGAFNTHPLTVAHYENLNGAVEVFKPWLINEAIYWHFLEMLPPLKYTEGGFLMSEFKRGNITTHYFKKADEYYCEFYDTKKAA